MAEIIVSYLVFVGALVFEFLAPPLDQILTTPGHLSNWWRSEKLVGGGCKVKVRNQGQITDYNFHTGSVWT